MLHSMTGFGRAEQAVGDKVFLVEVKSLNGKQFDMRILIPSLLKPYEIDIRKLLQDKLVRGSVECNIFIKQLWYLCGKSNECLEYTLNYLSHLIQKPGELPLVALAFKSNQGVGKNMFFEKLVEMIAGDEYGLSTTQLDHVVGRFSMIHQKLLIILDEASGKATF